jgi:hypothetical protein
MHEVRPFLLLLEVLLAEDETFVPKRFVDPHACNLCRVVAGYGLRILYIKLRFVYFKIYFGIQSI